jgi:hypothetical protein
MKRLLGIAYFALAIMLVYGQTPAFAFGFGGFGGFNGKGKGGPQFSGPQFGGPQFGGPHFCGKGKGGCPNSPCGDDFEDTTHMPEPATLLLFGLGGAGLALKKRKERLSNKS